MSKKTNQFIRVVQWLVVLFMAFGVYELVIEELAFGGICPKVLDIPACYILAGCLIAIVLSFLSRKLNFLFSLGASIGWSLAAMGTYYQFKGVMECPKTAGDIPMCYISLGLFTLLFILDQFRK